VGLQTYQHKRNFARTPEPKGKVTNTQQQRFVVHEHHASHLHYDVRLEMGGVLKSWAVPKGPSLNPRQKRLAVMVEDHPVAYLTFAGQIAEGNYGAGEVKIWDAGRYEAATPGDLLQQLDSGKLSIVLHGKRLRGEFHLVRMEGKERQWLLIKGKDAFAETTPSHTHRQRDEGQSTPPPAAKRAALHRKQRTTAQKTRAPALVAASAAEQDPTQRQAANKKVVALPYVLRSQRLHGDLTLTIDRHSISLTHVDKLYWPEEGYTKGDLIRYYFTIAPTLLPYLQDRPLILKRYPNGIHATSFYQHDVDHVPQFVRTFSHRTTQGKVVDYVVCNHLATLLYLTNLGTIGPHPWHSRIERIDTPDWLVFDLDPQETDFAAVQEFALHLKDILDRLGLAAYAKTSGAAGMHLYVPLEPLYTYEQAAGFAELVARHAIDAYPHLGILTRAVNKRQGKRIYLDYLQNARGKSVVAPYAVRAEPGAPVSTPLTWKEVARPLDPRDFNLTTLPQRLTQHGDPFKSVLTQRQRLGDAMEQLQALLRQAHNSTTKTQTTRRRVRKGNSL
jgi:bifunctional non-homologous end joining protein LigD